MSHVMFAVSSIRITTDEGTDRANIEVTNAYGDFLTLLLSATQLAGLPQQIEKAFSTARVADQKPPPRSH